MGIKTSTTTLSTTAKLIVEPDLKRTALGISNYDTSITIFIGEASDATGFPIYAQGTIVFDVGSGSDPTIGVYAKSATGTPTIYIIEEFSILAGIFYGILRFLSRS